jgi:carboxyl-terminal processing protease
MSFAANVALATAMALAPAPPATGTAPMDPVLAEVIRHASTQALNATQVDWPATSAEAARRFAPSGDEKSRTDAIRYVLAQLRDGHSHYRPPLAAGRDGLARPGDRSGSAAVPGGGRWTRPPIAEASRTRGGFGRLEIRAWTGHGAAIATATRKVRAELLEALSHDSCGVVIDVGANGGGNMWPMMGGIAPLYDDGLLLTFAARAVPSTRVKVRGGRLHLGDEAFPRVDDLPPLATRPRFIALVVGRRTASSGEILALGFRHQANVRVFGAATAGATTANSTFPLANGGLLALTTAQLQDRNGVVQQGPLRPDVPTAEPLVEADGWLAGQCR